MNSDIKKWRGKLRHLVWKFTPTVSSKRARPTGVIRAGLSEQFNWADKSQLSEIKNDNHFIEWTPTLKNDEVNSTT